MLSTDKIQLALITPAQVVETSVIVNKHSLLEPLTPTIKYIPPTHVVVRFDYHFSVSLRCYCNWLVDVPLQNIY